MNLWMPYSIRSRNKEHVPGISIDGEFHYQAGLHVEVDIEGQTASKVKWYRDGSEVEGTIWDRLVGQPT